MQHMHMHNLVAIIATRCFAAKANCCASMRAHHWGMAPVKQDSMTGAASWLAYQQTVPLSHLSKYALTSHMHVLFQHTCKTLYCALEELLSRLQT